MPDFLYFLFNQVDQQRIDPASVLIEDVAYASGVIAGVDQPQSLRLTCRILDPQNGPPTIRPMVPGNLQFQATGGSPPPGPADVLFLQDGSVDPAPYATWTTLGTILVTPNDADVVNDLTTLAASLEVAPNRFWYSPVTIPIALLDETLLNGLDKASIVADAALGRIIAPSEAAWKGQAVSSFLGGMYAPKLNRAGGARTQDDMAKYPMPLAAMQSDGTVAITITMARNQSSRDGQDSVLDQLLAGELPGLAESDPAHPRNGMIPARHVYRRMQASLVDRGVPGEFTSQTADAILADWPLAPRYFPIRFTRVWQPLEDCSIWFLLTTLHFEDGSGNELLNQRLPTHGMFYLSQQPVDPDALPPFVTVSLLGPLRLLAGATPEVWKLPGDVLAQPLALTTTAIPHIVLRLPMRLVVPNETTIVQDKPFCVFASLRRVIRAWIDNRICGGRLIFRDPRMARITKKLIDDSLGFTSRSHVWQVGPIADADADPLLTEGLFQMRDILEIFFPDDAPAYELDGTTHRDTVYTAGGVAYRLWLSAVEAFEANSTKCNFPDEHRGRGAAGALAYLGLAEYHVYPDPEDTAQPSQEFIDTITANMLDGGLISAAALQFWNLHSDFKGIVERHMGSSENLASVGHSPIFFTYNPSAQAPDSITVMDQHEDLTICPVADNGALEWGIFKAQVWIAANWIE